MIVVNLEPAANGVVKRVINQNAGGGKETVANVNVFEFKTNDRFQSVKSFLFELCEDLGVETGNKFDKSVMNMVTEWGSHYEPTAKEIKSRISELEAELELLKTWTK